jgi:hypothetical protein
MCTTTSHWATHISDACSRGGNAQCDGTCDWHGTECTCWCHTDVNLPETVEDVLAAHDEFWDVVFRVEHNTVTYLQAVVKEKRDALQTEHGDVWNGVHGAQFRTMVSSKGLGWPGSSTVARTRSDRSPSAPTTASGWSTQASKTSVRGLLRRRDWLTTQRPKPLDPEGAQASYWTHGDDHERGHHLRADDVGAHPR